MMFQKCNTNVAHSKDVKVVKIAVQYNEHPDAPQLIGFDQRQSLNDIIRELCTFPKWGITAPDKYALQFHKEYVTEENRDKVKNGEILFLTKSAPTIVTDIINTLENGLPDEKAVRLKQLKSMALDLTFANEFIKLKGIELLMRCINTDRYLGDKLADILVSFINLMDHGTVLWENVEPTIKCRIMRFITQKQGPEIMQPALEILDNIVQNSKNPALIDIKLETLLDILETSIANEIILQNTVALINSLFQRAINSRKTQIAVKLSTKKNRDILNSTILPNPSAKRSELIYQLYVLQTLVLCGLYGKQIMMTFDTSNTEHTQKIDELKRIAFPEMNSCLTEVGSVKRPSTSRSLKIHYRLGFKSELHIDESFQKAPPGILPLDCLLHLAQFHLPVYKSIIAEISSSTVEYEFPLGEIAIELTKILCILFRIGEPPNEQGETFYAIFFSDGYPLYEIFCICIEVLNQTWRDMKATKEDFNKVCSVANEQISRTLTRQPASLSDFRQVIKSFTYAKITKLREEERASREEYESTVKSIVKLKLKLTPHILKMIRIQRLNFMVEGTRFHCYSNKGQRIKEKYWYVRLSKQHKVLYYGDCDDEIIPTVEQLKNHINVNDIKEVLVNSRCPIAKKKGQTVIKCAFAIEYVDPSYQPCQPLEFIAPDELTQNYWVDGLNILLNLDMDSITKNDDLDTLLAMEIKLRLLDTDGVKIDNVVPPIPTDPEDYMF